MFDRDLVGSSRRDINVIVVGASGMLGSELCRKLALRRSAVGGGTVGNIKLVSHSVVDVSDVHDATRYFLGLVNSGVKWDYVVNCAAFTDTAKCEDWACRERSYRCNAIIPRNLATICHLHGIRMIHVSTNEVFPSSLSAWKSSDVPSPMSVYGTHKFLGEIFVQQNMAEHEYAILRTSWLYGMTGAKSFIHKCARNFVDFSRGQTGLFGIREEISSPTSVEYLVDFVLKLLGSWSHGVFHVVNNDSPMSRLDYMRQVLSGFHDAGELGDVDVDAIRSSSYDEHPELRRIGRVVLEPDYSQASCASATVGSAEQLKHFVIAHATDILKWARGGYA